MVVKTCSLGPLIGSLSRSGLWSIPPRFQSSILYSASRIHYHRIESTGGGSVHCIQYLSTSAYIHSYNNSRIQTRESHVCNAPAPTACSPHPEYNLDPEKLSKVRVTRTKAGTSSASGLPFPDPASEGHRSSYFSAINLHQRPRVRPGMVGASPILLEPTILTSPPRLGDEGKLGLAACVLPRSAASESLPPLACTTPEAASPLTQRFTQSLDASGTPPSPADLEVWK